MAPTIERVVEGDVFGEGPHWDIPTQSLFYVDILSKALCKYTPETKEYSKIIVGGRPSFIIPVEGSNNRFVVAIQNRIVIFDWESRTIVEELSKVDDVPELKNNTINDGKCDSSGRLWLGSIDVSTFFADGSGATSQYGTLYSFGPNKQLKTHVNKIKASNGFAFNESINKLYHIDTMTAGIDQYDFDLKSGCISNRTQIFNLRKNNILEGLPDGMSIDFDGNLWVAVCNGNKVIKVHGQNPDTLLDVIELPAKVVTSTAWGGKNLDELYVTTAGFSTSAETLGPPIHGAIYRITGTGSKGLQAANFKL